MNIKYKRAKCEILNLESYLGNMVIREVYKKLINIYVKELYYVEENIS